MKSPIRTRPASFRAFLFLLLAAALTSSTALPKPAHKADASARAGKRLRSQDPGGRASPPVSVPRPQPEAPAATPTPTPHAKGMSPAAAQSVSVAESLSGGALSGYVVPTPNGQVNLTAAGTLDWAQWAKDGPASFNHKAGVAQQISNFTQVGPAAANWFQGNGTTFSWSDGTPTASAANVDKGLTIRGVGNGYELNVPADTSLKTLKLYLGAWYGQGRLEATLSDGSAPTFVDTSVVGQPASHATYTVSFNAASAGQNLKIRWTLLNDTNAPNGAAVLMAASLVNGPDPNAAPVVNISSPADGSIFDRAGGVTLKANALDADGTIAQVNFYADGILLGPGTLTGTDEYSFAWENVFAGNYTLTAVATDNEAKPATSAPSRSSSPSPAGAAWRGA